MTPPETTDEPQVTQEDREEADTKAMAQLKQWAYAYNHGMRLELEENREEIAKLAADLKVATEALESTVEAIVVLHTVIARGDREAGERFASLEPAVIAGRKALAQLRSAD